MARWCHACAKVTRFNQDHIVVIGGSAETSDTLVIEFYDLATRPSSWEIDSGDYKVDAA